MAAYSLEIVEGPEAGRTIPLTHPVVVGRDPSADVVLMQDELVSRRHVQLTPANGEVLVEDLDSVNGTFVDGDQIFSPAHLLPDGQLVVGVTVLQLKTAAEAEAGGTSVRPIPESLAGLRPLPSEPERAAVAGTTIRRIPGFGIDEQKPTYVPDEVVDPQSASRSNDLFALHDSRTKRMARHAPFALALLVAIVVMLFLGLR